MCYQFLTYYPRKANFKGCVSSPHLSEVNNLLQNLNEYKFILKITILN